MSVATRNQWTNLSSAYPELAGVEIQVLVDGVQNHFCSAVRRPSSVYQHEPLEIAKLGYADV